MIAPTPRPEPEDMVEEDSVAEALAVVEDATVLLD